MQLRWKSQKDVGIIRFVEKEGLIIRRKYYNYVCCLKCMETEKCVPLPNSKFDMIGFVAEETRDD